jgi:uncharacterized protein YlxW (UPF0749 family)
VHIDNPFAMVVMIVLITAIAGVFRAKYGITRGGKGRDRDRDRVGQREDDAETRRLREEVKQLKDRLAVIERITVEKESSLERQIESLRDH